MTVLFPTAHLRAVSDVIRCHSGGDVALDEGNNLSLTPADGMICVRDCGVWKRHAMVSTDTPLREQIEAAHDALFANPPSGLAILPPFISDLETAQ